MVKAERRVRIKDIAQELDISFGSAFNIIHECLGYRKVSCQWVPKQLDHALHAGIKTAAYGVETSAVSCEKEIPYCAICSQSDVNSILWLPWTAHAGFHATRCYHQCWQILFHTVNSVGCDQKEAPQDSRCWQCDHSQQQCETTCGKQDRQQANEISLGVPRASPYSLDLAPSDFHLFSLLKKFLAGQRFTCDDEVKAAEQQWFRSLTADFYHSGIAKLVLRWDKCLNRHRDYVEK